MMQRDIKKCFVGGEGADMAMFQGKQRPDYLRLAARGESGEVAQAVRRRKAGRPTS